MKMQHEYKTDAMGKLTIKAYLMMCELKRKNK